MRPVIKDAQFLLSLPKWKSNGVPERPQICFAGRSNVGKSSLINYLCQRKALAKTSSTPGRTQALVVFEGNLTSTKGETPIILVDLPGYGYAKVPKDVRLSWRPMMESFFEGNRSLCATIFLFDIRRDPRDEDLELLESLSQWEVPTVMVITKADKVSKNKRPGRLKEIAKGFGMDDWRDFWVVSVEEKSGFDGFADQIQELVAEWQPLESD